MSVARGLMPPWLVRRDLLSPDECRDLLGWALDNEARFRPAALDKGLVDPAIRRSLSLRDLGPFSALFEDHVRAMVPELIDQLRVTPLPPARSSWSWSRIMMGRISRSTATSTPESAARAAIGCSALSIISTARQKHFRAAASGCTGSARCRAIWAWTSRPIRTALWSSRPGPRTRC